MWCSFSRRHSILSVLWITDRSQVRCLCFCERVSGWSRGHASARRGGIENDGYECRGRAHLPRRLRYGSCISSPGSVQVELLRSLSRFPVHLLQRRMDRLLDSLDDSLGCANTLDGWSLWLDRPAVDVDFHCGWIRNLDLPDVSGLRTKTFQVADRWQIRRRTGRRKAVMFDPISQM